MSRDGDWGFSLDRFFPHSCLHAFERRVLEALLGDDLYEDDNTVSLDASSPLGSCMTVKKDAVPEFLMLFASYPEGKVRDWFAGYLDQDGPIEDDLDIWFDDALDLYLDIIQTIVRRHPALSPVALQGAYVGQEKYGWCNVITLGKIHYFGTYEWGDKKVKQLQDEKLLADMGGVWVEA